MNAIKEANVKDIVLPDGTKTDTWSREYMTYCEALNLSKQPYQNRKNFLFELKNKDRGEKLKYWLTLIWDKRASK